MTSRTAQYWDDIAAAWQRDAPQQLWRRHCDAVHAALLERWLGDERVARGLKTDLFDEAVGEGLFAALSARAETVTGVDVSPRVVDAARRRHPALDAVVADVRRLPFADGSFDAIVSNSTLDHFDSPDEIAWALNELARVLRPGGTLVVTLNNPLNPLVQLRNALPIGWLNRLGVVPYQVGATCGPRALARLVRAAGLEVTEATAILHCPRVPAVAVAGWLDRRGSDAQRRRLPRWLAAWEKLEARPSRYFTGHFVAVRATRPAAAAPPETRSR